MSRIYDVPETGDYIWKETVPKDKLPEGLFWACG